MAVHPNSRYIPAKPNATWRYDKQQAIYERELAPMSSLITARETNAALTQPKHRTLRWIAAIVGGIVLLLAAWFGFMVYRMNYVPSDLDLSTTRRSNQGVYQASYAPRRGPIVINQIHAWTIYVATADGQPVTDAVITLDGDMPQHGHGLPTRP